MPNREQQPSYSLNTTQQPWAEQLRKQRKEELLNPDLFLGCATVPFVQYLSTMDSARINAELLRIGQLLEPQRQIITWTTAQPAFNLETGKPIARIIHGQKTDQVRQSDGSMRDRISPVVTRAPVATPEELFELMVNHPNPSVFYLPNFHMAFEQHPDDRRALVDMFNALYQKLAEQQKTVILHTPPGTELPRELSEIIMVVSETPVSRDERAKLLHRAIADTGLRAQPQVIKQVLDAMTGLNLTQSDTALRAGLTRRYAFDKQLPLNVMGYKREQMAAQNMWESMDTRNVPELVGWDRFEDVIRRNMEYGRYELGASLNEQMVLLIGQAGTGKTTMARRLGILLNRPVYQANVAGWMGSLMGQTEQKMKAAVDAIYAAQPCIALIDEAQRVLQAEDQRSTGGTMNRSVGTLLSRIEQGRQNGDQVLWVLTANEKSNLPPELFRRGSIWAVHFPGPKTRVSIFESIFKRFSMRDNRMQIDRNLTRQQIAEITQGYGGGELEKLIAQAAVHGNGVISERSLLEAESFVTRQDDITPEVIARRRAELSNYPSVGSDIEEAMSSHGSQRARPQPGVVVPQTQVDPKFQRLSRNPEQGRLQRSIPDDEIVIHVE